MYRRFNGYFQVSESYRKVKKRYDDKVIENNDNEHGGCSTKKMRIKGKS